MMNLGYPELIIIGLLCVSPVLIAVAILIIFAMGGFRKKND